MATKQRNPNHPWSSWLTAEMDTAGINNAELSRLSDGAITEATISYWRSGGHSAKPDKVIRVAQLLDADIADGLRAAGHALIADLIAGRPPRPRSAEPDPVVAEAEKILGDKRLTPEEQLDAIAHLNRRVKTVVAEVNAIVETILASRNEAESA